MKRAFQIVPAGSSIRATTPYRVVKMDLKKITAFVMLVLMVIPSFGMAMVWASLSVETDSLIYEPGEDVKISGKADPNANVSLIVVFNATQDMVFSETILADGDGEYSSVFLLPGNALEGRYNLTACNVTKAETFFDVVLPEPSDDETAVGLICAIERAYIFIDKINATAKRLEQKGYVVQDIDANLTDAKFQLEKAKNLLDLGYVEDAELEFSIARENLGSIMGWVHSTAKKVKLTKTVKFMEQFKRQIQGVNGTLLRLKERLGADVTANARGVLTSSMNRLQQLRRRMGAKMGESELDAVLDELDDVVDDMVEDFGGIIRGNRKGSQNNGSNGNGNGQGQ